MLNVLAPARRDDGAASVDDLPSMDDLPEVTLVGHSSLLYWWPVWLTSLCMGVYSVVFGDRVRLDDQGPEMISPDSETGVLFIVVLLAVIGFTSVRIRGVASVAVILAVTLVALTLAYLELWSEAVALIPELSVHVNSGFYFVFGGLLLTMWLLQFFIFDRLTYYRIRPGQELDEVNGDRLKLEGMIQERYGVAKEEAKRQVDAWLAKQK